MYTVKVPRDTAADAQIIATTIAQIKPMLSLWYSYAASNDPAHHAIIMRANKRINDILKSLSDQHGIDFLRTLESALGTTEIAGINLPAGQIKDIPVMALMIQLRFDQLFFNREIDQLERALLENNILRAKDLTERILEPGKCSPEYLFAKFYIKVPNKAYSMEVENLYFKDYLVPKIQEYLSHAPDIVREYVTPMLYEYDRIRHEKKL